MRRRHQRSIGIFAALALSAALFGCQQTTIADINKHPVKYEGDEVTIAGEVTQSGGDFTKGNFEVNDGTGKLWVLSTAIDLPAKGSRIAVTGLVESGESQGSSSLPTVLQEIRRYQKGS